MAKLGLKKLVFSGDLLVGVDIIDEQHKFLVALFNNLIDQLNDELSDAGRNDVVIYLFEYTKYNFAAEEQVMSACKYPRLHSHKKQHDAFILILKDFTKKDGLTQEASTELAQFLSKWIQYHILIADKEFGLFVSRDAPPLEQISGLAAEVDEFLKGDSISSKELGIRREVSLHQMWVAGKSTRRAELEFRDMSYMNFDGIDLSSAVLTGVNFAKSTLRNTNLSNAVLVGADLEEADLSEANLTGADLRGANLHRALLTSAVLRGADLCSREVAEVGMPGVADVESAPTVLTEAKLEKAVLCNAKLAGCDFTGADMADADLAGADLSGSVMIGADLHGVRFDGAIMTGTVIDLAMLDEDCVRALAANGVVSEAPRSELTVEKFVSAIKSHEQWIESGGSIGSRLDFDRVIIPSVKMTGRRLAGSRMRRCRIEGGEWLGVDLSMSDLSYSDMREIVLEGGMLRGTTLRRANLAGASLVSAVLDALPLTGGGREWPTNLEGASLVRADLSGASLEGVILRKADLTGCTVEGISVRNADFEGAKR